MGSRKSYYDKAALLCPQCGDTFPEDCGARAPYPYDPDEPRMQGARRLLCSSLCAASWYTDQKQEIADRQSAKETQEP